MADLNAIQHLIKEKDVKFVDFRFTDPRGKWQHTARMASATDEGTFVDGVMFIMMVAILVFRPQGLLGERPLR